MNRVLVDTSVWVSFLKGAPEASVLLPILDSGLVCVNDLILAELLPALNHRNESVLAKMLSSLDKLKIEIDWREIIRIQTNNLKNGINRVGIPDLIIAQNAIQNQARLLSFDRHFELMKKHIGLKTLESMPRK
jgi:predicted nucleic acid-binding protein